MILNYIALGMLVVVIIAVVYGFIWIHDIPYQLAKKRNHPNLHAIHVMGWVSLFTLHAIWPFLFLWAIAKKPQVEVIVVGSKPGSSKALEELAPREDTFTGGDAATLRAAIDQLQTRLDKLEAALGEASHG